MELSDLVDALVKGTLSGLVDTAKRLYPDIQWELPAVAPCSGTKAGQARYEDWEIRLNFELLLKQKDVLSAFSDTLTHEWCHLVARILYPKCSHHGPEWKGVMWKFGQNPKRCHNYEIDGFKYKCGCQEHTLTKYAHNKTQSGVSYTCKHCHGKLRPVE